MTTRNFLPLEQFTFNVVPPELHRDMTCVNIYEDGKFNMNGKLAGEIGGKTLAVRFTDDARHLCLREDSSQGAIKFPKSGSRKLQSVIQYLKSRKIPFPAKYEVHYNDQDQFWQGDVIENPTQERTQRGANSKTKS